MNVVYTRTSSANFEKVCENFVSAVARYHFVILGIIDLKLNLDSSGIEFEPECRVFEICSPQYTRMELEKNILSSTVLPFRVSLYEEGELTNVSTIRPGILLDLFHQTELWPVTIKLEEEILLMINEATMEENHVKH